MIDDNEEEFSFTEEDLENLTISDDIIDDIVDDIVIENGEEVEKPIKKKYDSIFKGKKMNDEDLEELSSLYIDTFNGLTIKHDVKEEDDYIKKIELTKTVYDTLIKYTNAKMTGPRRKPSRTEFNIYYSKLLEHIDNTIYTKTELFCELSQYFSDNFYSMLKLLQKEWSDEIITELHDKYRKINLKNIDFL